MKKISKVLQIAYISSILLFIFLPVIIMIVFSFNSLPSNQYWQGFTTDFYVRLFQDKEVMDALFNSLSVALASTAAGLFIGTLGAYAISRIQFKGRKFFDFMVVVPLVVPEIVLSVAFLGLTEITGIQKGFGVIACAHTVFVLPYIILTMKSRFSNYDVSLEEASMDLGGNRFYTFLHVVCPMIMPGLFTGGLMAFSLSFDDLIISNYLNTVGYTTLPVKIYSNLKIGISPEYNALYTIILVVISGCLLLSVFFSNRHRVKVR